MTVTIKHQLIALLLIISMAYPAVAQDDQPLITEIQYGMTVTESITEVAFFDWWRINAQVGDEILITMEADDGLQPLIGLIDVSGDLMTRSDIDTIAEVNGTAFVQYEVLTEGQYTIIATRDGRDQGETTGRYLLTVNNRTELVDTSRPNPFMETEFRCNEDLLVNALTFEIVEDYTHTGTAAPGETTEYYRVSVYGLDGFQPSIRLLANVLQDRPLDCSDSSQGTYTTQLTLPFLDEVYEASETMADNTAMVTLTNSGDADPLGPVTVSIGANDGSSGRFIVVLEGLQLHVRDDEDEIRIRRGPFANAPLEMYVLGQPNTRLDPILFIQDVVTDMNLTCDDIGQGDCSDILPVTTVDMTIGDNQAQYTGDRFDAGIRIDSQDNNNLVAAISSREASTQGEYVVIFVGELPARD